MKKKSESPFNTIRTIGRKAQDLLRQAGKNNVRRKLALVKPMTETAAPSTVNVRLATGSVALATVAVLLVLSGAWVLFALRHSILLLLLAIFVATLVDPGVRMLERWRVPRGIGIVLHYFFAIFIIGFLLFNFIPILGDQMRQIINIIKNFITDSVIAGSPVVIPGVPQVYVDQGMSMLRDMLQKDDSFVEVLNKISEFSSELSQAAQVPAQFAINLAGSIVTFFVSLIVVLVLAFFIQMEKETILDWFRSFLPHWLQPYFDTKSEAIHTKIGQWVRGELLLMFSIFSVTLIALSILGLDYALTLAVLAGFCELIPAVGPLFAALPALLIAGTQKGLIWIPIVAGVYYMIQWCENNLLVPLIMRRAVGLSPVAIIFAMLVGISFPDTLHPVLGVMLAVPTTTIITLFLEDWRSRGRRD